MIDGWRVCLLCEIMQVVTKKRKEYKDHTTRRNYDDFNEFFWTPTCLRQVLLLYTSVDYLFLSHSM